MNDTNLNSGQFFIGLAIQKELFLENPDWLKIFDLDEIDPEEIFEYLIEWTLNIHKKAKISENFGKTIHFSGCYGLFTQDWFSQPYLKTINNLKDSNFYSIAHISFSENQLPLHPDFVSTLITQLDQSHETQGKAIVIHAPRSINDTIESFVKEMENSQIISKILQYKIPICIENAQDSGTFFQSLKNLLQLRNRLIENYNSLGYAEMEKYIKFCFDTGHYLLFQQRDGNETEDWDLFYENFLTHTTVFHIHANDGSKDQHLMPYTESKLPEEKYPFNFKQFFENCHQILDWIEQSKHLLETGSRYLIFEVEPYFTEQNLINIMQKITKKLN